MTSIIKKLYNLYKNLAVSSIKNLKFLLSKSNIILILIIILILLFYLGLLLVLYPSVCLDLLLDLLLELEEQSYILPGIYTIEVWLRMSAILAWILSNF